MGRIVPLEGKVEIDAETLLGALRPSQKEPQNIIVKLIKKVIN
jgi:hypothetical protein